MVTPLLRRLIAVTSLLRRTIGPSFSANAIGMRSMPPTGWNMVAWKSKPSSNSTALHRSISRSVRNATGSRRSLEHEIGRQIPVGLQERDHALLVLRGQLLIERAAVERLAEQLGNLAARIVMGLAHLDGLAAIGGRVVEAGAAAGVDLDLERDAEFLAIA